MKKVIFKSIMQSVVVSLFISYVLMAGAMYNQFFEKMQRQVQDEAEFCKIALEESRESVTSMELGRVNATRLTVIASDGTPVFDSEENAATMTNHLNRPEIKEALEKGRGSDSRLSETLGQKTYYYAILLKDGHILRMAGTVDSVFATLSRFLPVLFIILFISALFAMLLAKRRTKRLVQPLNDLDLKAPLENDVYEELSPLLQRIEVQNKQIESQMQVLKEQQEEFLAITENMREALVFINKNAMVISMNKTAQQIFQVDAKECLDRHVLVISRDSSMREAVEQALCGNPTQKELILQERCYTIFANPVYIEGNMQGAVLLILDVTEKKASEKLRQEFTANVSHELKTPLMSISGYAELMKNNMVKEQDILRFAETIYQEAARLTTLVEDIIKLSRLDENRIEPDYEQVDMLSLSETVLGRLSEEAAKKSIRIRAEGEHVNLYGIRQILDEILYNLCDNAIKYNEQNGEVVVTVRKTPSGQLEIMVSDTGIGIPQDRQERVFERFYRVDKSHSRESGGTGLGLSIVKHGTLLHHGEISLESSEGVGTKITLCFQSEAE